MIAADLIARARDADLLSTGQSLGADLKRVSSVELAGPCLLCGGTDRFSINRKQQVWHCRGCAKGGNVISLVQHVRGFDFREAVAFLAGEDMTPRQAQRPAPTASTSETRASLTLARIASALGGEVMADRVLAPLPGRARHDRGLTVIINHAAPDGFAAFSNEAADFKALRGYVQRRLSSPPPKAAEPKDNAFVEQLIADIVRELVPVRGTLGEQYLSSVRQIDTDAISDVLERTDAIGWHPSVLFREKGHALDGRRLGCIVGVMTDPVTAMQTGAISRTYIHEGRKVGKAKTLGAPAGIVRLSHDEDVLLGLHLAEGLETALTAMAAGFRPMWSTGSTSLMAKFPLLSGIECLTVFADHDINGAGLRAAQEAAARWQAAGRETHVWLRDAPGDFNDAFSELGQ